MELTDMILVVRNPDRYGVIAGTASVQRCLYTMASREACPLLKWHVLSKRHVPLKRHVPTKGHFLSERHVHHERHVKFTKRHAGTFGRRGMSAVRGIPSSRRGMSGRRGTYAGRNKAVHLRFRPWVIEHACSAVARRNVKSTQLGHTAVDSIAPPEKCAAGCMPSKKFA